MPKILPSLEYKGYTLDLKKKEEKEPLTYCPKCNFPCISKEELVKHFKFTHIVKEANARKEEATQDSENSSHTSKSFRIS